MKASLKKYLLYASIIIVGGSLLFILVQTIRVKNTGFEIKTLWDWMELLIIPLVLAIGAILINLADKNRDRQIADDRTKLEREIATDRQQEVALQSYIDKMADLLLEKELQYPETAEVIRKVATIRTLSVLRGLDPIRKGLVLYFLKDAGLIYKEESIIHMEGTDLQNARLRYANLKNTDLRGADLQNANLEFADLRGADLRSAGLKGANLDNASLQKANLQDAEITKEQLSTVESLKSTIMPDGTIHE